MRQQDRDPLQGAPREETCHLLEEGYQVDIAAAGAEFVDGADVDVDVGGQMVSARAWPDHPEWMRELIQILQSTAPA